MWLRQVAIHEPSDCKHICQTPTGATRRLSVDIKAKDYGLQKLVAGLSDCVSRSDHIHAEGRAGDIANEGLDAVNAERRLNRLSLKVHRDFVVRADGFAGQYLSDNTPNLDIDAIFDGLAIVTSHHQTHRILAPKIRRVVSRVPRQMDPFLQSGIPGGEIAANVDVSLHQSNVGYPHFVGRLRSG